MNPPTIESYVNILAGITTMIAIAVGGYWSWRVFVRTRQKYPRAVLSHQISHLPLSPGKKLVHVDLTIENTGDVIITIASWAVWIQQVLPLDLTEDEINAFVHEAKSSGQGDLELPWYQLGKNINSRPAG
ncbi:MAG: hypothetical protein R3335_03980 [Anaerolineales bacterium]|nr:hypothetical protein [Anaerolineales bacterium]